MKSFLILVALLAQNVYGAEPCEKFGLSGLLGQKDVLAMSRELIWLVRGVNGDSPQDQKDATLNCMTAMLEAGAQPDAEPSLSAAVLEPKPYKPIIELLLKHGADPNSNPTFRTPVETSVLSGNTDTTKLLLEKGGKLEERLIDKYGTAMHYAASSGSMEMVKFLLDRGFNVKGITGQNESPLHAAAREGKIELVKFFAEKGLATTELNSSGESALTIAVSSGSVETAKYLVSKGIDPRKIKTSVGSLLTDAAMTGRIDMLEYVLSVDGDVQKTDLQKNTPLHLFLNSSGSLRDEDRRKGVELLLAKGADVNAENTYGQTSLMNAIVRRFKDTDLLVKKGADVNKASNGGVTPLMAAAETGDVKLMKLLLEKGADPTARLGTGQSAYDYAVQRQQSEAAKLLKPYHDASKRAQLIAWWNGWSQLKEPFRLSEKQKQEAIDGLTYAMDQKSPPPAPPSWAPQEIKTAYASLLLAKKNPAALTAAAFDLKSLSPAYINRILEASRGKTGVSRLKIPSEVAKFYFNKASENQTLGPSDQMEIVSILGNTNSSDSDEVSSLLEAVPPQKSGHVLANFKSGLFSPSRPSIFFVLKMAKALLSTKSEERDCDDLGQNRDFNVQSLSESFCDLYLPQEFKPIQAKLFRKVLAEAPLCGKDREMMIKHMRELGSSYAPAQHELVCAVAQSSPADKKSIDELLAIAGNIGISSSLNEATWKEQIKALMTLRQSHPKDALTSFEEDTFRGILRYSIGSPAGDVSMSPNSVLTFDSSPGFTTSFLNLCRDAPTALETKFILDFVKSRLDAPRSWPATFRRKDGQQNPSTLRKEFEAQIGGEADLKVIEQGCASVVKSGNAKPTPSSKPGK